jgi:hypothetical protein
MRRSQAAAAFDQDSEEMGRMGEEAARLADSLTAQGVDRQWAAIEHVVRSGADAIRTSFEGVIQGTQSIGDAFRNMAQSISLSIANAIIEITILEPLIQSMRSSFTSAGGWSGILSSIGGSFAGSFDSGGMVPGPIGAPRMAMVHGGETILPTHKRGMSGMQPVNVSVKIDGDIIPRNRWTTPEDVVNVVIKNLDGRGSIMGTIENRMTLSGRR